MTAQPVIRLRLLGRFSAVVDGAPPVPFRIASKKGIALLAYLILHPEHTASRERLATLLWGDRSDRQARLNLRQCILALRNAFAPVSSELFMLDGDAVGLRMELLSVDALEFESLHLSAEIDSLERAASLYSGSFLSDIDIDAEDFAAWLRTTRARFEAGFARVLGGLIDRRDVAGQGTLAISAAERLTAIDPLREDWQCRLLLMYARYQCSTAALSHARALTALLKEELDVEPEPATTALIEQIQRGDIDRTTPETEPQPVLRAVDEVAPIAIPDHRASMPAECPSAPPPQQPVERGWHKLFTHLHPAAATSLIVFLSLAASTGLLFLAGTYLVPIWAMNQLAANSNANMASAFPERAPIVVLPFESVDGKESGAIAEQVSGDVIDSLSHVPNLKVISRLTSREYREQSTDIAAIGNRLGVRYALHGSVQTEADKLHVNVELIDIASRLQVWSDRFEEDQPNPAVASDEIAKRLGRSLQVAVINFQAERAAGVPPENAEIGQLVAKGWGAIVAGQYAEPLARAEAAFTEALRRDPDRLGAMLGLAAHHSLAAAFAPPEQRQLLIDEANRLLRIVIERRPDWSPPYYYRGQLLDMQGDPQAALESLEKSIALNPSFASGYAQIGRVLTRLGQADAALENINHAMVLSPKDPALPAWEVIAGLAELERGHDAEALELISRATMLQPNNPFFQSSLAVAYALAGDRHNAEAHAAKFRELTPNLSNEQRIARFSGRWQPKRFATGARLALTSVQ